jgi:Outer membrane protein beta-barrel domain
MKKLLFTTLMLTVLTVLAPGSAWAVEAKPAQQIQQTAETAATSRGFWLELKLGSSIVFAGPMMFIGSSPGFVVGYKFGRLTLGAEVGVGYSTSNSSPDGTAVDYRSLRLTLIPQLQVNVVQRGPLAIYVVGGAGVSAGWTEYGSTTDQHSKSMAVIMQLGFGARTFLHPHFALGLEVTANASYGRSEYAFGDEPVESRDWSVGLRGALTAAVVF